jgi:hypothetical protein
MHIKAHSQQAKIHISQGMRRSTKKVEHSILGNRMSWHLIPRKSEIYLCCCGKKYIKTRGKDQNVCLFCLNNPHGAQTIKEPDPELLMWQEVRSDE